MCTLVVEEGDNWVMGLITGCGGDFIPDMLPGGNNF